MGYAASIPAPWPYYSFGLEKMLAEQVGIFNLSTILEIKRLNGHVSLKPQQRFVQY